MLSKITRTANLLKAARSFYTVPNVAAIVPESVEDAITYLDKNRPEYTCVYFHAAWNPMCEKVEEDYHNFCNRNAAFTHLKVDSDATPKLKFYFDARVEPQCIFLLNGKEVKRQVGYNFNLMDNHCEEILEFHLNKNDYYGDSGKTWERFYDSFDRWARDG